ncbi:MAG: aminopeptidase N [Mycobacteriales bacterium]
MRTLLRSEAARRADILQVLSYEIALDLTGDADFISTTLVRFRCRVPGAASFAELDASPLEIVLNGRPLPTQLDGARIPLSALAGDNELRVVARGSWSRTGEGLHRFTDPVDGAVYVWAQSFLADAQRIFACFDQPDLKAPMSLTVHAPEGWTVIGNERGEWDGSLWTFRPTQPLPPYLFTVAAGPWHGQRQWHDGIELGVWCRRSLAAHLEADELLEITAQCFDSYHRTFGVRYPFGDTYDQVWVPEFNHGAMENAGAVTVSEDLLFRSRVTDGQRRARAVVLAHEMAHMWFGNLVTMRWWDDLWLNESFAELMGFHTTDVATRFDGVWTAFCASRKAWGYRADQLPTTHPVSGVVTDSGSALQNFDGISYAKGAAVLRQLLVLVGDHTFFAAVREYLRRHAFGTTTLADFLAAVEQSSGRDLTDWASSWLLTAGVSTLRVSGDHVVQEPPTAFPVLREHRIGVGRFQEVDGALVRRERLIVDVRGARTPLPAPAVPAAFILPNDGDWTFAKIRFDAASLAVVIHRLNAIIDPLARALCWAALWDAARDGELRADAFVDAVLTGAGVERDTEVLARLVLQARMAAELWLPTPAALGRLAQGWARQLAAAPAASDLQLTWMRAWVSVTADDAALWACLQEGNVLPGLVLDTELRWLLLVRLAVLGAATQADIDAELRRDATAAGQRHADTARAAQPAAAAKAQVWQQLTQDTTLSNAQAEALAAGFWQPSQLELVRPYSQLYMSLVGSLWESRAPQLARSLARDLYPRVVVEAATLTRTGELLADALLPSGLRRILLEQSDDLRRALAARALSC